MLAIVPALAGRALHHATKIMGGGGRKDSSPRDNATKIWGWGWKDSSPCDNATKIRGGAGRGLFTTRQRDKK